MDEGIKAWAVEFDGKLSLSDGIHKYKIHAQEAARLCRFAGKDDAHAIRVTITKEHPND